MRRLAPSLLALTERASLAWPLLFACALAGCGSARDRSDAARPPSRPPASTTDPSALSAQPPQAASSSTAPPQGPCGKPQPEVVELSGGLFRPCVALSDGSVRCLTVLPRAAYEVRPQHDYYAVPLASMTGVRGIGAGSMVCGVAPDKTVKCTYPPMSSDPSSPHSKERVFPTPSVIGAAELAVGEDHACARLEDGSVTCWGRNQYGQAGTGVVAKELDAYPPTVVKGLSKVKKIAAGGYQTCAVREDDTVVCWGLNRHGECNTRPNQPASGRPCSTPAQVPGLTNVQDLALRELGSCALLKDGAVKCWGLAGEPEGALSTIKDVSGARRLFRGFNTMCAELGDGAVRCFSKPDTVRALDVKVAGVKTLAHASHYLCLLGEDKKLKCGLKETAKDKDGAVLSDVCF